tara:strand:- start:420 stop:620 length:201 start_codon:yes stop_codon:yes gene_type:complete
MSQKCEVCQKHDTTDKDYRFIDELITAHNSQDKVFICKWCVNLSDIARDEICNDRLDPKVYYARFQ